MLPVPPAHRTAFADDAPFIDAFEKRAEWRHAAHLRMAWIYVRRHGLEGPR